jgi:hypothetical protein
MAVKKLVNGQLVDMTLDEEAAFEAGRAPTLQQARAGAIARVAARKAAAEAVGVVVIGKPYGTTPTAVARLAILATKPANDPRRPAQPALLAVADRLADCDDREAELLAAIESAPTVAAVQAIDINVGWPA